jgi:hypothetical protein
MFSETSLVAERIESDIIDIRSVLKARERAAARERERREWLRGWAYRLRQAEINSPVYGGHAR